MKIFNLIKVPNYCKKYLNNKIDNIMGIPTLIPCLFVGFLWGLYATIKGSWF